MVNLDCEDNAKIARMRDVWCYAERNARKRFGSLSSLAHDLHTLVCIASDTLEARAARLDGRIGAALNLEADADRLYRSLPEAWRW